MLSCYILQFETHLGIECTRRVRSLARCCVQKIYPVPFCFERGWKWHRSSSPIWPWSWKFKVLVKQSIAMVFWSFSLKAVFFFLFESRTLCTVDELKRNMTFAAELESKCRVSCYISEGSGCWPRMPKRYLNWSALNISNELVPFARWKRSRRGLRRHPSAIFRLPCSTLSEVISDTLGDKQVRAWLDSVTKSFSLTYGCELA